MKAKRITLIYFIIIGFSSITFSQNVKFGLYGNFGYTKSDDNKTKIESLSFDTRALNDTTLIREYANNTLRYKSEYSKGIGYTFGSEILFRISNRFSIRSGIGIESLLFQHELVYEPLERMVIESEIIEGAPIASVYLTDFCDFYENTTLEFADKKDNIDISNVYLSIPLNLYYSVWSNKINAQFGLLFQTPIYTKLYKEDLVIRRTSTPQGISCRWELDKKHDTSGNNMNNSFLSFNAEVDFFFVKNIGLGIGMKSSINNLFANQEFQTYPLRTEKFKPFQFFAGLKYRFVKSDDLKREKKNKKRKRRKRKIR